MPVASTSIGRRCEAMLGIPPTRERLGHAEPLRRVDDLAQHRPPAQRRLGPAAQHHVTPGAAGDEVDRRPGRSRARCRRRGARWGGSAAGPSGRRGRCAPNSRLGVELLGEHGDTAPAPAMPASTQPESVDHEHGLVQSRPGVDVEQWSHRDNTRCDRVGSLAVKFGVHTGVQNTTTQELARALEAASRATDSTGSRSGTTSTRPTRRSRPRESRRAHVSLEAITAHTALAMSTSRACAVGSLVYCVGYRHPGRARRTRWPPSTSLSGGRVTVGLGAGWHQARVRRLRHPVPARAGAPPPGGRGDPVRPPAAHRGGRQLRRRVLPAPRRAVRPQAGAGAAPAVARRRRREGHVEARRRARRRLERAVRDAGGSTRTRCRCSHATARPCGRDPGGDRVHREPRVGVARRGPRGAVRRHRAGGASQRAHGQRASR